MTATRKTPSSAPILASIPASTFNKSFARPYVGVGSFDQHEKVCIFCRGKEFDGSGVSTI
jgi:hypothetical protein